MKTDLPNATSAWPLAIFLPFPPLTRAETAIEAWVQCYNGPGNYTHQANAVAADRGDGSFEFEDANAARLPHRYYRMKSPQ